MNEFLGYALTLQRPWPSLIFHLPPSERKTEENRGWRPPSALVGNYFAVHAGKGAQTLRRPPAHVARFLETDARAWDQGVIGLVRLRGWVWYDNRPSCREQPLRWSESLGLDDVRAITASPWFMGRDLPQLTVAWALDDPRPLRTPLVCSGHQGLWRLPQPAIDIIRQELQL